MRAAVLAPAVLAIIATSLLPLPSLASGKEADADRRRVDSCLAAARAKDLPTTSCLGSVAEPCLRRSDADTARKQAACVERELIVWEERLASAMDLVAATLPNDVAIKQKVAARALDEARVTSCPVFDSVVQGSSRGGAAYCELLHVATQALAMEMLITAGGR